MDLDLDDLLGPVEPTDNAAVALDLAHRGFAVFPITRKADGSWTPIVHWQQRASRDPGVVAEMWRDYPKARVGFPCGQVNGVSVIDVDVKDGKDGCQSLADLGFDPREMTPAIARSPSGGWHLFFQADGRLKNWVGKLGEGLDVRTTGGYVLAPGSFKDGARYEVVGALPSDTSRLPLFPEMLIPVEAAREVGEVVEATERQREWAAEQFAKKVAAFEALTEEGSGRNALVNEIAMWAGGAAAHGMLDHAHVEARLLEAAEKNGHAADRTAQRATRKTISNGWNAGLLKPISEFPREDFDLEDLDDLDELDDLLGPPATVPAVRDDLADLLGLDDNPIDRPVPVGPGVNPNRETWGSLLDRNTETGVVFSTLPNVELIVANDDRLYGRIGFNELEQCIVFIREPGRLRKKERDGKPIKRLDGPLWMLNNRGQRESGRRWIDAHTSSLRAVIESPKSQGGYGIKVADRDINAAIENVARRHTFHPVRDYLRGLKWDGSSRIDGIFIDYLGAPDTPYHRAIARLFCLGAVTRAFEPGHKFDWVPILEGAQGLRKSTYIGILGKSWAGELALDFQDNKSVVESMQGKWLYELPELQGFSKADTTTLKAIISRQVDRARLAYGRLVEEFPRQCVMIGSTNDKEYLRDTTGGRRFWPVACRVAEIDTDRLRREVDQIWAEAVVAYDVLRKAQPHGDLPLFITDEDAATEAKLLQDSRRSETPEDLLAAEIVAVLDEPESTDLDGVTVIRTHTCVKELWIDLLKRDPRDLSSQITTRLVGKALRMAGWEDAGQGRCGKYGSQKIYRRA